MVGSVVAAPGDAVEATPLASQALDAYPDLVDTQAELTAALDNGGIIPLAPVTIDVTSPLAISTSGTELVGAENGSSVIRLVDSPRSRSRRARDAAGDLIGSATASLNVGEILSDQGHLDDAEQLLTDALRSFRRAGYEVGIAVTTSYLGRLRARRGDYEAARSMLGEAEARFEAIGASHFVLETRAFEAECEVLAGHTAQFVDAVGPLLQAARDIEDPLLETILLRTSAWAHLIARDFETAEPLAQQCLELSRAVDSLYEEALSLIMLGQIHDATGRDRRPYHSRAPEILNQLGVVSLPRRAGT